MKTAGTRDQRYADRGIVDEVNDWAGIPFLHRQQDWEVDGRMTSYSGTGKEGRGMGSGYSPWLC